MSRRSIFLLAATVVLLYFSLIVFMLSPLHGARQVYYSVGHRYALRGAAGVTWCKEPRYQPAGPSGRAVALASFPGSGNTWLRYLLQQATGIWTGSVYMDFGLKVRGFPAENVTDATVLVVKTHESPPPDQFKAAVLLVRNPRDAILADFNRHLMGHVGTAPISAFKMKSPDRKKSAWAVYVSKNVAAWEALHARWLSRFAGRVLVVLYGALVRDTRQALLDILDFLNHTVPEEDIYCAVVNKEGIYRRRKKLQDFDPFSADMYRAMAAARARVAALITDYYRRHNITDKLPSIGDLLAQ
ncbi:hypothetical protein MSG28_005922 [Choristoneura fumiferana]|uniref:Uncharacterized protein n=1 Tax=Choristoneura fumiferana TaxID=7141 RepID=A0ACC0L0N1_CHOFU|nr:hypothetical protein MSG28_005922 [Choristoneura fumiferana]